MVSVVPAADVGLFYRRISRIYESWDELIKADSIVVPVGQCDDLEYCKSLTIQEWLFNLVIPDILMVFGRKTIAFLATRRNVDFLKPLQDEAPSDGKVPKIELLVRDENVSDKANFEKIISIIQSEGKKVGVFAKDKFPGNFHQECIKSLFNDNIEKHDVSATIAYILAVKEESELQYIQKACNATETTYSRVLFKELTAIIDKEKRVSHKQLSSKLNDAIAKDTSRCLGGINASLVDTCYIPIIQSGGNYNLEFAALSNDDDIHHGTIVSSLGIRYKRYCSSASRTLMIDPTDEQKKNYEFLLSVVDEIINRLSDGVILSDLYNQINDYVKQKRPDLVNKLTKNFGFVTGIEFREGHLVIGPKTNVKAKKDMTFVISAGFSDLVNSSGSDPRSKNYALFISDTVIVNESGKAANLLTQKKRTLTKTIVLPRNEDESKDEDEENDEKNNLDNDVISESLRGGARRHILEDRLRQGQHNDDVRREHQQELLEQLDEAAQARLSTGSGEKVEAEVKKPIAAYKSVKDFPRENEISDLKIFVDERNEAVILPVFGVPVPFHISTIKNVSTSVEGDYLYLRINFFFQDATLEKGVAFQNNEVTFLKELTYRSYAPNEQIEVNSPAQNLNDSVATIKTVQKKYKTRVDEEKELEGVVKQDDLRISANKVGLKLKDLCIRPNIHQKRISGSLEAHVNGFRFTSIKNDKVDIMYNNVKHAIYQPCDGEMIILLHFNLKNPIMLNKKKHFDVQFYTEVGEITTDLGKRQHMHDRNDHATESAERELRNRLKLAFKSFCDLVEASTKSEITFEIPMRERGFYGVPKKSNVLLQPTPNALVNLTEPDPTVITLSDIELVHFERVSFQLKNFDMVIVFKDYNVKPQSIAAVDMCKLEDIKNWLYRCDIKFTSGKSNLNWPALMKASKTNNSKPTTLDGEFECLKSALFHETAEVRAAALRAIRYLLKDETAVEALLRVDLPIFIVRSIDIVLENRTERIQALRLVRKFLSISPHLFPSAFTRSLIAIAQDGQVEHDTLTRACWALLAELSIMSPVSSTRETQNCAFNAIMDAALSGNQPHGMCESLISTLLYMLNWPKYRRLIRGDLDLQIFVAPFTDSHYTAPVSKDQKQRINQQAKFDVDPYDQRENKFTAAKITLISILRSWQGLIYLCEPQSSECNLVSNSCLKSLINMLYLPYNDVRRRLIDLLFELLYLPLPDSLTDFETGLKFLEKNQLSMDSWKIHDAFVVDEAKAILPPQRSRTRMNLVNDYLALLLVALFHCNVVDALSEVIITPLNQENSIRATILLYQLLTLSYQYLPTDSFSQYLTLSTLISHATSKVDDSRDLANAALINLGRVNPLKKSSNYTNTKCSIFLNQILEFCSPNNFSSGGNNNSATAAGLLAAQNKNQTSCGMSTTSTMSNLSTAASQASSTTTATTNHSSSSSTSTLVDAMKHHQQHQRSRSPSISSRTFSILSRSSSVSAATSQLFTLFSSFPSTSKVSLKNITELDWPLWDWEHINFLLTRPSDAMKRLSSPHYKAFIRRLVHFFKPSSNQYSLIDINNEHCRQLCETGCNMVDFLVESPEPKATELLRELLHDISISMHDPEGGGANNGHGGGGNTSNYNTLTGGGGGGGHLNNNNTTNLTSGNTKTNNHSYNSLNSGITTTHHQHHHHQNHLNNHHHHHHPHHHQAYHATATPTHSDVNILSSSKLITTMSSTYFIFIGRLSSTLRGFQMLERSSIMRLISNLTQTSMLATSPAEVYVRLIISCFDYTKEFNGSRQLLEKFLFHHPEENVRIYATNYLRVLLRANVPDFATWAMRLLVRQLNSPLRVVHHAAADILDEACDLDDNLEGLIGLKQVADSNDRVQNVIDILRSNGNAGHLLLCRYASSPSGLRYLIETPRAHLSCPLDSVLSAKAKEREEAANNSNPRSPNHGSNQREQESTSGTGATKANTTSTPKLVQVESEFDVELDRWQQVFNYRYVKIVEDVLNNSLTYHQKGEDGKYGRRIDRINPMTKNSHLPPHLYGQLALHPDGIEIIQSRRLMEPIYETLHNPPSDLNYSEVSMLKVKASLWAIGNVGSSESGYQILENSRELIKLINEVAKSASVLSLRGTAFYVLGLLGSTEEGAEEMKEHGWIVQKNNMIALPLDLRLILNKPQDDLSNADDDDLSYNEHEGAAAANQSGDSPEVRFKPPPFLSLQSSTNKNLAEQTNHNNNISRLDNANDSGISSSHTNDATATAGSSSSETKQQSSQTPTTSTSPLSTTNIHPILMEKYPASELEKIRKDILKHVTNLSHSVVPRPAENSLLNLKRKYGLVFQHDLALYYEVCNQLAKYNFRLHARRFLQELFLDIT